MTVIHLPASVEVTCESCFAGCRSLASVRFDADSKLSHLECEAFSRTGLTAIQLPTAVEVICEWCFASCGSLGSVTFGVASKLSQSVLFSFPSSHLGHICTRLTAQRLTVFFLRFTVIGNGRPTPCQTLAIIARAALEISCQIPRTIG
jgi:hypothetical protein